MSANAGIHTRDGQWVTQVQTSRDTVVNYDQLFLDGPTAGFTIVGEASLLKWLAIAVQRIFNASGRRPIVVGRLYSLEASVKADWGKVPAAARGAKWANDLYSVLSAFIQMNPQYEQLARSIYWQPKDETKNDWEWQVEFEIAAMDRLCGLGFNYGGVFLFTGTCKVPPIDAVEDDELKILLPVIRNIKKWGPKAIGTLHAYIETLPLEPAFQKYHALRPQAIFDYLRKLGLVIPWVITETGSYEPWERAGIKDQATYATMIKWMFDQYQGYPEVASIHPYDNSIIAGGWFIQPEVAKMIRTYNDDHIKDVVVTPVPTPAPVPSPVPVPGVSVEAVTAWPLNLRASPVISSGNLIKLVPAHTSVTLTGNRSNGYAEVLATLQLGDARDQDPLTIRAWLYDQGGLVRTTAR